MRSSSIEEDPSPGFASFIPPPADDRSKYQRHQADREFAWPSQMSEHDVRAALAAEVRKHSCWRAKAVRQMRIEEIKCYTSLHYTLETFTESRCTVQTNEPYTMANFMEIDAINILNPNIGNESPWEIDVNPTREFAEEVKTVEMPGTSDLHVCNSCAAEGVSHCFHCQGSGTDKCQYCRGTGMKSGIPHPAVYTHPMVATYPHGQSSTSGYNPGAFLKAPRGSTSYAKGTPVHFMAVSGVPPPGIAHSDLCFFCHGRGMKDCSNCKGQGKKHCATCSGSGSIRTCTKLKVKFAVEKSEFYHNEGLKIPDKHLKMATGELVVSESLPYVLPLKNYPIQEVNEQSKHHCQIHLQKLLGSSKILKQRQNLEAVPVACVHYSLGHSRGHFWVYGTERYCHVPNYPSKCVIL